MELAQEFISRTRSGGITWTPVNTTNTAFQAHLRTGTVEIASDDEDGAAPFTLTVFDPSGRRIESLTTRVRQRPTGERVAAQWNPIWRELYDAARTQALNIDALVDGLLNELKEDDIPF